MIGRRKRDIDHHADKAMQEKNNMQREQRRRKEVKGRLQKIAKEDQELFWACSDAWNKEGVPWRLFGAEYSSDEAADGPGTSPFWATGG